MLIRGTSVDRRASENSQTESLFWRRMSTLCSTPPVGQDLTAAGFAEDGAFYFCKADSGHRPIRATEQLFTCLAKHLNIAVAQHCPIDVGGEILFGSMQPRDLIDPTTTRNIFNARSADELGRPDKRVSGYLSRLALYDYFIDNIDRSAYNFVSHSDGGYRRLLAIDFASATLLMRPRTEVGMPSSKTANFAKLMKHVHGFDSDAALEMLERIRSVPVSFVQSVMDNMPQGWLDEAAALRFMEFWGGNDRNKRLARLEAGISNGSLY